MKSDLFKVQMFYTTGTKADWHSLDARYFVIKSNNMDNVEISMEKVRIQKSNLKLSYRLNFSVSSITGNFT